MLPAIEWTIPATVKDLLRKHKQWRIDRLHPIPARYFDWK